MKKIIMLLIVAFSLTGCVEALAYSAAGSFGSSLGWNSGAKIGSTIGDKVSHAIE